MTAFLVEKDGGVAQPLIGVGDTPNSSGTHLLIFPI